ncbi:hypothetical protein B0H19DRAFT_1023745 [Mycena capillaripes]|nr:hypothetical protein B0H19DRAFT_1023745 [Mycena capillaripes]
MVPYNISHRPPLTSGSHNLSISQADDHCPSVSSSGRRLALNQNPSRSQLEGGSRIFGPVAHGVYTLDSQGDYSRPINEMEVDLLAHIFEEIGHLPFPDEQRRSSSSPYASYESNPRAPLLDPVDSYADPTDSGSDGFERTSQDTDHSFFPGVHETSCCLPNEPDLVLPYEPPGDSEINAAVTQQPAFPCHDGPKISVHGATIIGGNVNYANRHTVDAAVQERLEKWLQSPPEMTQRQHETEKLRKEGTGRWFLEGNKFMEWLSPDYSGLLWIEGPSGTGKSVLSATVIKQLFADRKLSEKSPAIAFFYFDFRDKDTRSVEIALRRIVLQLSAQSPYPYRALGNQYRSSNGQKLPSYQDLHGVLRQLLHELGCTYIVLDGLDECDGDQFDQLVGLVSALRAWTETPLHLLITSQTRSLFTKRFEGVPHVALEFDVPKDDIKLFISSELETNSNLEIWKPLADRVVDGITRKSNGMFRLAACLLIELYRSPWAEEEELDKILEKLPEDLSGIYDRFLQAIRPAHFIYVEAALRWIMFSNLQPITLTQLADALAFNFSGPAQYIYKPNRREDNVIAIPKWLTGFVEIGGRPDKLQVSLAHASVQDYLLSKHFQNKFTCDLSESISHTFISRTCMSYLLYFGNHPSEKASLFQDPRHNYPLAVYAAHRWCQHLSRSHDRDVLFTTATRLLQDESEQYTALSYLLGGLRFGRGPELSPLHVCCQEGYIEGVCHLLLNGADVNLVGHEGSPLVLASKEGYTDIVRLLFEHGADVNLAGKQYGSALVAASYGGKTEIVNILLASGADINRPCKRYGNALMVACYRGHIETVRLLLENGVDIDLECGENKYGRALVAASSVGRLEIVRLLLKGGADLNLQSGHYGSALSAASYNGHIDLVRLLLHSGPDVNLECGYYGNALGAACRGGHIEIVRLLLESGAHREPGSTTEANPHALKIEIVYLLRERGADIELGGRERRRALEIPSRGREHGDRLAIPSPFSGYGNELARAPFFRSTMHNGTANAMVPRRSSFCTPTADDKENIHLRDVGVMV